MTDISKIDMNRINGLLDKLDEVTNKINSMKYVVETWSEGTEWYRVWSDGWIEQGGRVSGFDINVTIIFKKSFTTVNYTITQAEIGHTGQDPYVNGYSFQSLTTNSAVCVMRNNGVNTCMWYACGY